MSVGRVLSLGRRWLPLALVAMLLGGALAFVLVARQPATYVSRVSLMVGPPPGAKDIAINDVLVGQALAPTYAQLATTRPILTRAVAAAKVPVPIEELAAATTTHATSSSGLIDIDVAYRDAAQGAALANAIGQELASYTTSKDAASAARIAVTVVDPAVPATAADGSRVLQQSGLGAAIGLALIVCLALLVESVRRQGGQPTRPVVA